MPEIVPFVDEGLGNSSYLVDLGGGRALVIDASRDPAPYAAEAERRGLSIAYAADTHLHADFVSGGRELAAQGAEMIASAAGHRDFPVHGLADGDEIDLGGLRLRALATPGHTAEHLAYLLLDGTTPLALFSGGSLIVGSVARTDLVAPERTEELSRALYRSLHAKLIDLPDELAVYPTHGAGSFCTAPASAERTTTIGRERAANPMLAAPDEDTFVRNLIDNLGSYPEYFHRMAAVNRHGARVYGALPALPQLSVAGVRRLVAEGAVIVDVRPAARFVAGHIPGALSISLRMSFGTWLGWVVPENAQLVFVIDDDQDRTDLVRQALKVGYENIAGELEGGIAAWRAAGGSEQRVPLEPITTFEGGGPLIDVRQSSEYAQGHVPGAELHELGSLSHDIASLPAGPLSVMCEHGDRATTAASLVQRAGRSDVSVVFGSAEDWAGARGQALEAGR
ncbi:MAG: MBL fold metallo-hydrolase [Candidatus Dormibacteria bacterium]